MDNVRVLLKAFIMKDDKFFTIKRAPDSFTNPNQWDIPGGTLEYNENIMESLVREIKEESGLSVKNIKPVQISSGYSDKQKAFRIEIGFKCDYDGGKVKISDEHTAFKWVTKDEFPQMNAQEFLKEFVLFLG